MSWYSSVPSNATLDNWIKNSYNVLFHGRHGVGKTSMVFDAFKRAGWEIGRDFLYFSAATIDPWVDLIGVPARITNEKGEEVLKLIRPATIDNESIKVFFVDEFNRSHKKVRNAMMELIQFKSINGLKFPNLKMIWGAVNPDEDSELKYDVEKLDPAQEDRFHIHCHIPYKPNQSYFAEKYNDPEMAEAVCSWWDKQSNATKLLVTPRRLEYAIDVFQNTNDLRFVLPTSATVSSLKEAIQIGNPEKTFKKLLDDNNEKETRKWLSVDNNLTAVQKLICENKIIAAKSLHLLSDEKIISFAANNKVVREQIKQEPDKFETVIQDIAENSTQRTLKEMCIKLLSDLNKSSQVLSKINIASRIIDDLNITKRRKTQIINNYKIDANNNVPCANSNATNITKTLVPLVTECSFFTDSYPHQRDDIFAKLEKLVSLNMNQEEALACLKIIEFIVSYAEQKNEIIDKYLPVINSTVIAWTKHQKESTLESMFNITPYLVTNILSSIADNPEQYKLKENDIIVKKIADNTFEEIPETKLTKTKTQKVEDLF